MYQCVSCYSSGIALLCNSRLSRIHCISVIASAYELKALPESQYATITPAYSIIDEFSCRTVVRSNVNMFVIKQSNTCQ